MKPHRTMSIDDQAEQGNDTRGTAAHQIQLLDDADADRRSVQITLLVLACQLASGLGFGSAERFARDGDEQLLEGLDPCSAGNVFGSPSSRMRPCERNSTRSHTCSTSYMLCDVHSTPPRPCSANRADAGADVLRGRGIERRCRLVQQQQAAARSASPSPGTRASALPTTARHT